MFLTILVLQINCYFHWLASITPNVSHVSKKKSRCPIHNASDFEYKVGFLRPMERNILESKET